MTDNALTKEQIENLVLESVPPLEEQKRMVQEIETLIEQGVNPDRAVESVFGKDQLAKH